jgi:hypothetical protein
MNQPPADKIIIHFGRLFIVAMVFVVLLNVIPQSDIKLQARAIIPQFDVRCQHNQQDYAEFLGVLLGRLACVVRH